MPDIETAHHTLSRARELLGNLIEQLQCNALEAPAPVLRTLMYVVNIQKSLEQPEVDRSNAVRRLKDFETLIGRLDLRNELASAGKTRTELGETLRLAAEQLSERPAVAAEEAAGVTAN